MTSRRDFVRRAAGVPIGAAALGSGSIGLREARGDEPQECLPWISVCEFGAHGDGRTDDTAAIQAAFGEVDSAFVPPGIYRVDGTITLWNGKHLHLARGAILARAMDAASTDPVVRIGANQAALTGLGTVRSGTGSPRGVVLVGPEDPERLANMNFTRVSGITISSSQTPGDVGLCFESSEPSAGGSNYLADVAHVHIRNVGTGIKLGRECNGHTFYGITFFRVAASAYHSVGNSENTFYGGFTHFSPGTTVIRLEDAHYNLFYGVQAEPGRDSRYFFVDRNSSNCQIIGHDNCPNAPVDESPNLLYIANGQIRGPSAHFQTGSFETLRASSVVQRGSSNPDVSSETYEAFILADASKRGIRIGRLRRDTSNAEGGGLFYEVTIAGYASDGNDSRRYAAKKMVVAYPTGRGEHRIDVHDISSEERNLRVAVRQDDQSVEFLLEGFQGSARAEVVCEVRRVGLAGPRPMIEPF